MEQTGSMLKGVNNLIKRFCIPVALAGGTDSRSNYMFPDLFDLDCS
jgi:hypothetical protein